VSVAGDGGNDSSTEDFGYYTGRFAGAVYAVVGLLIRRETLRIEGSEAGLVSEQRAASHGHAAIEQNIEGSIQPNDGNACSAKKLRGAGLGVGSAAECEDRGFLVLDSAAQGCAQLVRFHLAECRLAQALENLRNAQPGGLFDTIVQIDKTPSQLAGQQRADSRFAGAHEAGEAKHLQARW
jgi:hypothetical protein